MPGQVTRSYADGPSPRNWGSLKGHKALPRRNHVVSETLPTKETSHGRRVRHKSDQIGYSSVERISSWIAEPDIIHALPVVGKPLTPPITFRDDFQSWIDDAAVRARKSRQTQGSDSTGATPLIQQSPPTPETTPPRKIHRTKAQASISAVRNTSGESRTDSFTTAKENQSSEDESHRSESPSLRPARQKWLRTTGIIKHKDVGLGLGLESEDEESTAKDATPKPSPTNEDFVTFDGAWGADNEEPLHVEGPEHEIAVQSTAKPTQESLPMPRGPRKRPRIVSQPPQDSPTLGIELDTPPRKSNSLRERVRETKQTPPKASTEKFAEQINWPLKDDGFGLDDDFDGGDDKRMSQASTASTVVEAMVFDSPTRRRQTLRRTSKMVDLNSADTPYQTHVQPTNAKPRHRLRKSKSPDQELRKSFASDSPELAVLSKTRRAFSTSFPDNRSSMQSSVSGSKRLSRTFSINSRQQSSRPTTAPEDAVGYFDIPQRRDRRTVSVVIHSPTPLKSESMSEKQSPPSAVRGVSTSSVPTSGPSTTTSVTSGGLMTHYSPETPTDNQLVVSNRNNAQDAPTANFERTTPEWSSLLQPNSSQRTPFSLRSAHSSTPGTLEVNEATAVSIYPHTNRSILVIQQMPSLNDDEPREQSAIIASNANIALPGPLTPTIHHESPPRELLSPLKNPRDPPQPPDFKIIPPTPANASLARSPLHTPPTTSKRLSAPITSIKRAFSARSRPTRSDPLATTTPFTRRSFSLRGTASTPSYRRRQTQAIDGAHQSDRDSKLHPFWRPRAFWDEGAGSDSDSDSEFGNSGYLTTSRMGSHDSNRSRVEGGAGEPRRTLSLTRRLTNSLWLPHPARDNPKRRSLSLSLSSSMGRNYRHYRRYPQPHYEYEFARPDRYDGKAEDEVPRQGYPVLFVGFRQRLAQRLEKRREEREEGRREERRRWIRGAIGRVGDGDDGGESRGW
ncbi:hypothetical protein MMC21_000574 [Puttea exsequens]|nr:hypothetical protein [Puttea exsequens]